MTPERYYQPPDDPADDHDAEPDPDHYRDLMIAERLETLP